MLHKSYGGVEGEGAGSIPMLVGNVEMESSGYYNPDFPLSKTLGNRNGGGYENTFLREPFQVTRYFEAAQAKV